MFRKNSLPSNFRHVQDLFGMVSYILNIMRLFMAGCRDQKRKIPPGDKTIDMEGLSG